MNNRQTDKSTGKRKRLLALLLLPLLLTLLVSNGLVRTTQAQGGGQNPTPIVIALTPASPTPVSGETAIPPGTAVPTTDGSVQPDRFESNDDVNQAASIGFGTESGLTLIGDDADYFSGYLKQGQMLRLSTLVYSGLDTRLELYWNGALAVSNDDVSPSDVSSAVIFTAPTDGWYTALVVKATVYDGAYDLTAVLTAPTATATPLPTMTPQPSPTPLPSPTPRIPSDIAEPNDSPETAYALTPGLRQTYSVGGGDVDYFTFLAKAGNQYSCETVTGQVDTLLILTTGDTVLGINDDRAASRVDSFFSWEADSEQQIGIKVEARGGSLGQYELICQMAVGTTTISTMATGSVAGGGSAAVSRPLSPSNALTTTTSITATIIPSQTMRYIGQVQPQTAPVSTGIRLMVYYDANNDRAPGPGEGIANVSVLAVDGQGQRLARIFTNAQGEAIFNLSNDNVARIIVPFVPSWSERVRVGEANEILLGLPAVSLTVFLPVQNRVEE